MFLMEFLDFWLALSGPVLYINEYLLKWIIRQHTLDKILFNYDKMDVLFENL